MINAIYMLNGGDKEKEQDLLNSFIITSESGTVIVIDGGHPRSAPHFLEKIKEITGQQVPHINAWFLTHTHVDHIACFSEVLLNYPNSVTVDKVIYNFVVDIVQVEKEGHENLITMQKFYQAMPYFKEKVFIPKLFEEFNINEFQFKVIHTAEVPQNSKDINNLSLAFIMSFNGIKVMFPADCGVSAGNKIVETFGKSGILKCDICQMAHHGQRGCDKNFYEAVSPSICLWNTPRYLWNNDLGKGYNTAFFKTIEVREWMEELGVKKHYVIKDGDCICPLTK